MGQRGPPNRKKQKKFNFSIEFYKTKLCALQLEGYCYRGAECAFAHSMAELRHKPNLEKTKLCQQYLQNNCMKGNRCKFAHGLNELRSTPAYYKKTICIHWKNGYCPSGDNCSYAHGKEDIRKESAEEQMQKHIIFNQMAAVTKNKHAK